MEYDEHEKQQDSVDKKLLSQMRQEDMREGQQDNAVALLSFRVTKLERVRQQTKCIIMQLAERVDFLETNNAYLMEWRVKHDNELARKTLKRVKTHKSE